MMPRARPGPDRHADRRSGRRPGRGYLTQRLRLSPIVGYLLAGIVVGPNTPGFVANRHVAEQLAEVGVILLMFGVGLQFHIEELLAVSASRCRAPSSRAWSPPPSVRRRDRAGWGLSAGVVYGVALSVASTVVLVRVLSDNNHCTRRPATSPSAGWSSRTCSRCWSWC